MGNCASVGGLPSMKKLSGFIAAGAFSRLSIVVMRPLSPSRMTMNPPPPMPQLKGSTTPSTPAAATAASNALPPPAPPRPPPGRARAAARVPPPRHYVDRRLGGERIDARRGPALADRGRLL